MMHKSHVPQLTVFSCKRKGLNSYTDISEIMDGLPRHNIVNASWPEYKTPCSASFCVMFDPENIYLKYYVKNDFFGTKLRKINEPVHKDNCVEAFLAFNSQDEYYNIEFNCFGVGKAAFGSSKNRTLMDERKIEEIATWKALSHKDGNLDWQIILKIPKTFFCFHQIEFDENLKCRGNFYKCGDDLPNPHFLSWNTILAPKPDFHQPGFFGNIVFKNTSINDAVDKLCLQCG